jgi:translation initiation factor 6
MLSKEDIFGNPYLGVFCVANENLAMIPITAREDLMKSTGKCLDVEKVIRTGVDGASVVGALMTMNSKAALASHFMSDDEINRLSSDIKIARLPHKLNAVGNNILVNDNGAVVHPAYDDEALDMISKTLEVPVEKGTVAGFKTVGSAAVATNKGVVCHPHTGSYEIEQLERVMGVEVRIATANYGTGLLGACMIANSKGALVGETSTPIELGKIEEGLKLY